MADVAIVNPNVTAVPDAYTVPGAQQILVRAVSASIDGTGAAGSFLPALQLLDAAGHVMWTACNTASPVTAGGSVDVSWFPGIGGNGAGAGTSSAWFFGFRNTNFPVAPGGIGRIPWSTKHEISDSTVFQMHTQTNANDTVNCLKSGIYWAATSVSWEAGDAAGRYANISSGMFWIDLSQTEATDAGTLNTGANRPRLVADVGVGVTQSVPTDIEVIAGNADAVSRNVAQAELVIAYISNSVLAT